MFMKIPKTLKITINFVKIKTEIVMNFKKTLLWSFFYFVLSLEREKQIEYLNVLGACVGKVISLTILI